MDNTGELIPFDVVKQFMTGKYDEAAESGKAFAGLSGTHSWQWVEAEMAINHGVAPATEVAACTSCHDGATWSIETDSKLDKLGYKLKDTKALICSQCHAEKNLPRDHERMHGHVSKGSGIDCNFCHDFKRPERGLCDPCDPACVSEFVDTNPYPHACQ